MKSPPVTFAAFVYVLTTLLVVTLVAFGLIATFRFAYDALVGEPSERADAAKVFFPVIVAVIGGPILIWRALTAHWAAQAAQRQAEASTILPQSVARPPEWPTRLLDEGERKQAFNDAKRQTSMLA